MVEKLRSLIRDVPDFPKPGVIFRDITPLLADPSGLGMAIELMANPFRGHSVDLVVGAESRGFIFGIAVAQTLAVGFAPIRKPGKLPHDTVGAEYQLEYGSDRLEIHRDAVKKNQRVLIVDDLIATGGTLKASLDLVEELGADVVGASVLIELVALRGRDRIGEGRRLHSLIQY
ncbi:MAG: adenine phosphoribosyltransferase [Phycisphaeraceae bacterium]|nr:MAG: adenine phosphoribosyltransferase [Phycisphaeraceae bacterium]